MSVREVKSTDYDGINALWESVWWPQRSRAGWQWLEANPALNNVSVPQGWVCENAQGDIRVVLGALVQRFWLGEESFYGLTGHSLVVAPEMRGASRHVISRILEEPGFFSVYTLNANSLSCRLYGRFGFVPHPAPTADIRLSWMLNPFASLAGRMLRHAFDARPQVARRLRDQLISPRLWHETGPCDVSGVSTLTAFDAAYERFWQKLRAEGRLIADRSPEIQKWRLADPDRSLSPLLFKYEHNGEIGGYACALFAKENPVEPVVLEIVDLTCLEVCPEAIPALMTALMTEARRRGAAKLRLSMVGPRLLAQLGAFAETARHEGDWTHAHLHISASSPDTSGWEPTPFDGDLFMSLRTPPRPSGQVRSAA